MAETTAAEASHGKEPLPINSADPPQETSNGADKEAMAMEPSQDDGASQDEPPPPPSSSQRGPPSLQTHLSSSTHLHPSKRPNILLIITDQERSHQHWPSDWAASNLPSFYNCLVGCCFDCTHHTNRKQQQQHHRNNRSNRSSVHFTKAFTATTECSPSRASLLTSSYPNEHGVMSTPGSLDPLTDYSLERCRDQVVNVGVRPNLLRLLSTRPMVHCRNVNHDDNNENDGSENDDNDNENASAMEEEKATPKEETIPGYKVAWKGKWHLTPPIRSPYHPNKEDPSILLWYGATTLWNPPDAGHSLCRSSTLGGGWKYNHDGRFLRGPEDKFEVIARQLDWMAEREGRLLSGVVGRNENGDEGVDPRIVPCSDSDDSSYSNSDTSSFLLDQKEESIFDFLAKHRAENTNTNDATNTTQQQQQPFFLVTSFVNPHDVWASACFANLTDEEFYKETGYHPQEFENLPIDLPPSHKDDLTSKPSIQSILNTSSVFGDLNCEVKKNPDDSSDVMRQSDALRYVRFYAHLHKQVDAEIASLLEALEANDQMDNTIIIRMADHGELALSHGLREKRMNCYEETIGIPLVINYPSGYFDEPDANTTTTGSTTRVVSNLVSSIDILPTIAELAGVDTSQFQYRGKSLVPFLSRGHDNDRGDEEFLFTFDEPLAPRGIPGYVRCLRTTTYKYAVYFTDDGSSFEYEMYDLVNDPYEMKNLTPPGCEPDKRWREYHDKLTNLMYSKCAMPEHFDWFVKSVPKVWVSMTASSDEIG